MSGIKRAPIPVYRLKFGRKDLSGDGFRQQVQKLQTEASTWKDLKKQNEKLSRELAEKTKEARKWEAIYYATKRRLVEPYLQEKSSSQIQAYKKALKARESPQQPSVEMQMRVHSSSSPASESSVSDRPRHPAAGPPTLTSALEPMLPQPSLPLSPTAGSGSDDEYEESDEEDTPLAMQGNITIQPLEQFERRHGRICRKKKRENDILTRTCLCGVVCDTIAELDRHIHRKVKGTYSCDIPSCRKVFYGSTDVKRHKITKHRGENRYPCHGKCNRFFPTKELRKMHQMQRKCKTRPRIKTGEGWPSQRVEDSDDERQFNEEEGRLEGDDEEREGYSLEEINLCFGRTTFNNAHLRF